MYADDFTPLSIVVYRNVRSVFSYARRFGGRDATPPAAHTACDLIAPRSNRDRQHDTDNDIVYFIGAMIATNAVQDTRR